MSNISYLISLRCFSDYLAREARLRIPHSLMGHFLAFEHQRRHHGYIRGYIETADPRFQTLLTHYLNYLAAEGHLTATPTACIYDTRKRPAIAFGDQLRGIRVIPATARRPHSVRGRTWDITVCLNVNRYSKQALTDTLSVAITPVMPVAGTVIIIHAQPNRRPILRDYAATRPHWWHTSTQRSARRASGIRGERQRGHPPSERQRGHPPAAAPPHPGKGASLENREALRLRRNPVWSLRLAGTSLTLSNLALRRSASLGPDTAILSYLRHARAVVA